MEENHRNFRFLGQAIPSVVIHRCPTWKSKGQRLRQTLPSIGHRRPHVGCAVGNARHRVAVITITPPHAGHRISGRCGFFVRSFANDRKDLAQQLNQRLAVGVQQTRVTHAAKPLGQNMPEQRLREVPSGQGAPADVFLVVDVAEGHLPVLAAKNSLLAQDLRVEVLPRYVSAFSPCPTCRQSTIQSFSKVGRSTSPSSTMAASHFPRNILARFFAQALFISSAKT